MPMIRAVRDIERHYSENVPPFLRFMPLLPETRSPPQPPIFLLGATNQLVTDEIFTPLVTPAIGCWVLNDAAVAPTGIALKGETAFCSAVFIHPPHHVVAVVDRINTTSLPVRHVPGPLAVIYGPGHDTHGHWLTDFMPRLAVLHDTGHDLARLRYLVPPDLTAAAAELLLLCGIETRQLVQYDYWHELLRTDLLLMPTSPRLGNRISPYFAHATAFWLARGRQCRTWTALWRGAILHRYWAGSIRISTRKAAASDSTNCWPKPPATNWTPPRSRLTSPPGI